MDLIEGQFDRLRRQFSDARLHPIDRGQQLVHLPAVPLTPGWTKAATDIWFVVPAGYPVARPDCFWAEHELRLTGMRMPQGTALNTIAGDPSRAMHLWFSWHVPEWSPNRDSLLSYARAIQNRLSHAQ